ncbi:MAG: hypothetical protein KTR24_08510 [Saprospiraceae bacterium]|nr:hypothetical protein [Saprospiraceae bacterium]
MRYVLHLAYNGTHYRGWQRQLQVQSVQQAIEEALTPYAEDGKPKLHGCGRTDAGVHALSFVAHVDLAYLPKDFSLPPDIYLYRCNEVPSTFHAQRDAVSRTYVFLMHLTSLESHREMSARYYFDRLDLTTLQQRAKSLIGRRDFRSFCKRPREYRQTYCTVSAASWTALRDGRVLRFEITADRFLRGMIRLLVAHMLQDATSLDKADSIGFLLGGGQRGSLAPAYPNGLHLVRLTYDHYIFDVDAVPSFYSEVIDDVRPTNLS